MSNPNSLLTSVYSSSIFRLFYDYIFALSNIFRLIRNPGEYLHAFSDAATEVARNVDAKYSKEGERVLVGFTGPFGFHRVTPRDLMSSFIGTMVCAEGIITKCKCFAYCRIIFSYSSLVS